MYYDPTTLVTIVTQDTAGNQGWTSISNSYDPLGFLVARVTEMDNGSTQSETFFGPQRLSLTVTDSAANNASWASRTTEWDWMGNKTTRTTVTCTSSKHSIAAFTTRVICTSATEFLAGSYRLGVKFVP